MNYPKGLFAAKYVLLPTPKYVVLRIAPFEESEISWKKG
jgi:hypothetical protein